MDYIFETEHLKVRKFESNDAETLYSNHLEAELKEWIPNESYADVAEAQGAIAFYRKCVGKGKLPYVLAIESKETGELIGDIGVNEVDGNPTEVEIGYSICRKYSGKGYAAEIVSAMTNFVVDTFGISVLYGRVMHGNNASARVMEKNGYKFVREEFGAEDDPYGRGMLIYKKQIPFWEEAYRNKDITAFSMEPNATIKEFEYLLNEKFKIIEAGCGEGQNVLYLASKGYCNIDAFDLSENGIKKLKHRCEAAGVEINAFTADLTTYQWGQKYDLVMSFGTLHFVSRDDWKNFIVNAKENTNVGGIHIMQIFTDTVSASEDIAPFAIGLAREGEIRELYNDWEILQFKSYVFEDEHSNVPKHLHASNKLVARKIK